MSVRLTPFFPDGDWGSLKRFLQELTGRSTDSALPSGTRVLKHFLTNTADSAAITGDAGSGNFSRQITLSDSIFQPGRVIKILARGTYTTTGTPGLGFTVFFGDSSVLSSPSFTCENNASGRGWRIEAEVFIRSASGTAANLSGSGVVFFGTSSSDSSVFVGSGNAFSDDTTTENNIFVRATWTGGDAGDSVVLTDLLVTVSDF